MAETNGNDQGTVPRLAEHADYLIELAGRAPSVHNSQPWRFEVGEQSIELYADTSRQLLEDPAGREMLISCGAALYGLRLGIRSLGYLAEAELCSGSVLLARVRPGLPAPMTSDERKMLQAVPHRHTHRGPFEPGPLPDGLLTRLRDDVASEGATLSVVDAGPARRKLTEILAAWRRVQDLYPASRAATQSRAETERWTRGAGSQARDGVPAQSFPAAAGREPGPLPRRDFDLCRGWGQLPSGGPPAPVTALLVTSGDHQEEWLRAGQGLQRLLLHAASQWVFASLQTEPLLEASVRARIQSGLDLPGWPLVLLQLGRARTTRPTARRPPGELTGPR